MTVTVPGPNPASASVPTTTTSSAVTPAATVRTFLQMRAKPGLEAEFEREWLKAAAAISAVPGNVRQDLMRNSADPREFTIVSDWSDRSALERFSTSAERDRLTVALRDLRDGAERMVFEVLHSVDGSRPQPEQGPPVRVLITTLVHPGEEAAFEQAYAEVAAVMRGTPGHVREELLHEPGAPTYHLIAEWTSRQAFLAWVTDPAHQNKTGPLIPYLKRAFTRRIFDIVDRPEEIVPMTVTTPALTPSRPTVAPGTDDFASLPAMIGSAAPGPNPPVARAAVQRAGATGAVESATEVVVVGAGPTGLTLALELARRGIAVRLLDRRTGPNTTADKAIGVHCRTMEIWEDQGIALPAVDRGLWLEGQIVIVNGKQTHRVEWDLPELPYAHLGLPQYETEDLLARRLAEFGGRIEEGAEVVSLEQDATGVDVGVRHSDGTEERVRATYVVGCDGAHSVVRKTLGFEFAAGGGRFPELFMLCDVEVDWDMPPNYLLRFIAEEDGEMRGMLVCVPLKGNNRYRIATLAPPRVLKAVAGRDVPPGFWQEFEPPSLEELQVALDRLAPPGTTAANLRWSSVFRISHGIVKQYRRDRIMIAGDAAHLHPPAGGQGMNTGIQDAYNLGWKLALAVRGQAAEGLLDSYEEERRPAGAGVVGRAVKVAFTDEMDFEDQREQFLHEMQMLLSYKDSRIVGEVLDWEIDAGPGKGDRAPDVHGLLRRGVGHPFRLFDLIRGTGHTVLVHVDSSVRESEFADVERLAAALVDGREGLIQVVAVATPDAKVAATSLPVYVDTAGTYRQTYSPSGPSVYVIRPDGHIGFRSAPVFPGALQEHLRGIFARL